MLLGCDRRPGEHAPGRSDTIMLFRINPDKRQAYLISIPRDSRVMIPGHGMDKINAAYAYGGPNLTIKTIEDFTGLDINHYAMVDFQGFKELIDSLGGIDVDVEKRICDDHIGKRVDLNPGIHHFDGSEALDYVRIRYVDSDFGRIDRQQKFLKAIMNEQMRLSNITRIPQLADIVSRNLNTDSGLGISEMFSYWQVAKSIGPNNIYRVTIPGVSQMIGEVSYVIPDKQQTSWLLDRIKSDLPPTLTDGEKKLMSANIQVQKQQIKAED